ncbi:hypothetical protein N1F78_10505 [Seonamhaeicola sp. MEBiC1930]|uniref:hypothetical protein n=1 Tax=Seonamhaeicola sp. MEBiC01930 TaxID=2976768 RepID=UPI00325026EF
MLAILLVYFIGKRFYDLSIEYNQKKWLYAILSIVVYYGVQFAFGFIIGILDMLFDWGIDWDTSYGWNLLGIPIGLLAVWGFYTLLENKWKKSVVVIKDEIQDIGKKYDEV